MPAAASGRDLRGPGHSDGGDADAGLPSDDRLLAYETILEESPLLITVYDRDLVVCDVSRAAADRLGVTRAELAGRSQRAMLTDDYVATLERVISGKKLEGEARIAAELLPDEPWAHALLMPLRNAAGDVVGGVTMVVDTTEQKAQELALQRSATLLEEAEALAHLGSWEWDLRTDTAHYSKEWQRIHGVCRDYIPVDEVVALSHPADQELVEEAAQALRSDMRPVCIEHRIIRASDGETRWVEAHGRPVRGEDGTAERVYGASLDITDKVLARQALTEREGHLQRTLDGVVGALVTSVEMRDPYTAGHQQRVAELTLEIARQLGWPDERVDGVHIAGLLHDIGKLVVPAEILAKPSRLSENEFDLIKSHAAAGGEILASVEFDEPVRDAILQHHERLDGSGYPAGLCGDEIIPEARVLAAADVFEAMVSHRPYRPALPQSAAVSELRDGAGVRYDPGVVAACLRLVEGGFEFSSPRQ